MATYIRKPLCSEISKCFKESVRSQKTAWKFLQTKKLTSTKKAPISTCFDLGSMPFYRIGVIHIHWKFSWYKQLHQAPPSPRPHLASWSSRLLGPPGIGANGMESDEIETTIIVSKNTNVSKFRLMISTTFPQKNVSIIFSIFFVVL